MGLPSPTIADPLQVVLDGVHQFRQIILYGPPGTGKTLLAQRLALALLAEEPFGAMPMGSLTASELHRLEALQKEGRLGVTVMHPAFGYDQFVIGVATSPQPASPEKAVRAFKCMHCAKLNKVPLPAACRERNRGWNGVSSGKCANRRKNAQPCS